MDHEKALALAPAAAAAAQIDFTGTWKNELGSEMTLVQNGSVLTGKYESAVSGGGGKILGDLSGWGSGRLISFSVNWPSDAITAWVGHLVTENGSDAMETLWQMATRMPDPTDPNELWESVLSGADRFTKVT